MAGSSSGGNAMHRAQLGGGTTALLLLLLAAPPAPAAPPAEGTCPLLTVEDPGGALEGDTTFRLEEGMLVTVQGLMVLRSLLPPEIWNYRESFFHEGMRMEIGPCHRRYPVPLFYASATQTHWDGVELDERGNLRGYVAGLPFPPDTIDPAAEDAAARWAWNLELRYRGAGPLGRFRLVDMPSRIGTTHTYEGSFFLIQTGARSDLAPDYSLPGSEGHTWIAGGRFEEPFNARHLAWRQLRPDRTRRKWRESDRTYVYVPEMRKPRRAATAWVDGLFLPRYSVSGQFQAGGPVPYGDGEQLKSISPTAGVSIAVSENIRKGFVGLALRPNAYTWTLLDERDVLAPLNVARPGWPLTEERNFGPSGLSLASDRWEVRRALVIRGVSRRESEEPTRVTLYVDYQTQQPLYFISYRRNGLLYEVGILAHRFSGDQVDYPRWPSGEPALVFDPVAASFVSVVGSAGWRRESYDLSSVPRSEDERRKLTSVAELEKGH